MFTKEDITILIAALILMQKSAIRQQNSTHTPMIKEVWAKQQEEVNKVMNKVHQLEPTNTPPSKK